MDGSFASAFRGGEAAGNLPVHTKRSARIEGAERFRLSKTKGEREGRSPFAVKIEPGGVYAGHGC